MTEMTTESINWTDPMREALIKAVQGHECIWQYANVEYRNVAKKRQIFWDIAKHMSDTFRMNITEAHVYRQWQSLRDRYRRAKKKMEQAVSAGQPVKPWRFMQMMKLTDASDASEAHDPMSYMYNESLLNLGEPNNSNQPLPAYMPQQPPAPPPPPSNSAAVFNACDSILRDRNETDKIYANISSSFPIKPEDTTPSTCSTPARTITVTCTPGTSHEISALNGTITDGIMNATKARAQSNGLPNGFLKSEPFSNISGQMNVKIHNGIHHCLTPHGTRRRCAAWSSHYGTEKRARMASEYNVCDDFALLGSFVESRIRAIARRRPRLGLMVQKAISDLIYDASLASLGNKEFDAPVNQDSPSGDIQNGESIHENARA